MFTNNYYAYSEGLPAKLSKVSIIRAHRKYNMLFDVVGSAKINYSVEPLFLNPNRFIHKESDSVTEGGVLICPLMLLPEWGGNCCNEVMVDAGRVWEEVEGNRIEERDYALLNEMKWFLLFKHSTDVDWEGSYAESRTVVTLQIFAILLHLWHRPYFPDDVREEMSTDHKWDLIEDQAKNLFQTHPGENVMPVMDDVLAYHWQCMVKEANEGRSSS